jgi:hypothetical protein
MQAQFPLHSCRIFGLAGHRRGLLGAVVAIPSLTGVLLWLRRRVG